MKTIFKLFAVLLFGLASQPLAAQEEPQIGFIRLVNAVAAGEGNTRILVDGEDLYPDGYQLGQRTGGIGLKVGGRRVTIRKDGIEEGVTTVDVGLGETTTLVAFAEKQEPKDEDDPITWKARILRLKQSDPERGYRLTVVSVCAEKDVTFTIATEARRAFELKTVKRFDTTTVDLGNSRGDVEVRLRDTKEVLCGMSLDEPGNYVAVIYNDAEGKIRALTFYDPKFVIAG
ncbi:MAG: hypothetical protein MUF31_03480 [Akkermansiaceae bacterium]|jgi:hypothetical protein|nr:hypothetical protein [Akkermansiaceae bacterium]